MLPFRHFGPPSQLLKLYPEEENTIASNALTTYDKKRSEHQSEGSREDDIVDGGESVAKSAASDFDQIVGVKVRALPKEQGCRELFAMRVLHFFSYRGVIADSARSLLPRYPLLWLPFPGCWSSFSCCWE